MMLSSRSCGIGDRARRLDDHRFEPLHRVVHDREQQVFLALDVVVEPGLGQIDRGGDVAHRRGVEALLVEDFGRLRIDVDRAIAFGWPGRVFSRFSRGKAALGVKFGSCWETPQPPGKGSLHADERPWVILPTVRLVNPKPQRPSSPEGICIVSETRPPRDCQTPWLTVP